MNNEIISNNIKETVIDVLKKHHLLYKTEVLHECKYNLFNKHDCIVENEEVDTLINDIIMKMMLNKDIKAIDVIITTNSERKEIEFLTLIDNRVEIC
jgi:hypothetical protein